MESSRDKKRMVRIEVTLSDWFYNALIGKEVLTINRDYFRLRKPLERRLYELARNYCGRQPEWKITLEHLKEQCGSLSLLRKFRFQLREIIEPDHLPDYQIALDGNGVVTFIHRLHAVKRDLAGQKTLLEYEEYDIPPIKEQTIQYGAKLVREAGTGWDYGAIREQFTLQLLEGFRPRNVNAAFIGFVKKKVAQRA